MTQGDASAVAKIKFKAVAFPTKTKFDVRTIHSCLVKEDAAVTRRLCVEIRWRSEGDTVGKTSLETYR